MESTFPKDFSSSSFYGKLFRKVNILVHRPYQESLEGWGEKWCLRILRPGLPNLQSRGGSARRVWPSSGPETGGPREGSGESDVVWTPYKMDISLHQILEGSIVNKVPKMWRIKFFLKFYKMVQYYGILYLILEFSRLWWTSILGPDWTKDTTSEHPQGQRSLHFQTLIEVGTQFFITFGRLRV